MSRTRFSLNPYPRNLKFKWLQLDSNPQPLSSIIWPVWQNSWVFVYEISGCRFESSCSHLNIRFRACFEQGVHLETSTWHDKNIQSNAPYRQVLTTQLNHLVSLAKWLSARLWTKWLWVLQFLTPWKITQRLLLKRSLNLRKY